MKYKIPFVNYRLQYQDLKKEINKTIKRVLSRGDLILRKDVEDFEKKLADFVGVKYAVGLNSGTDALFLSLKATGVGRGDEVITVSHTFVASIAAIIQTGAKPILVDVGDDFLMDVDKIEKVITKKTKAIIPVHLNGRMCDMERLMAVARKYNLILIEDAAQALGASFKGKMAGSFGLTGCFSFYPAKILGCYDEKTEVMTKKGWKYFKDLNFEDEVATLTDDNKMIFEKPKDIYIYDYCGYMFSFENKGINLLVTPNHNMYIKTWNKPKFYLREAWDLIRSSQWTFKQDFKYNVKDCKYFILPSIKQKKNYKLTVNLPPLKINMNLWLEFLGYYLSEGHISKGKGYKISISQSPKSKYYRDIKKCLDSMPFKVFQDGDHKLCFYSQQVYEYLKSFGVQDKKFISNEFKNLPPRKLKILLTALVKGDGNFENGYFRKYYTTSERLADDIQEISVKCGIYATISLQKKRRVNWKNQYIINFNKNINKTMVRRKHVSLEFYKGKVFCCKNSTHILYIRREGKVCWCGNSFGDGGAVTTNNSKIAEKIRLFRDHGQETPEGVASRPYGASKTKIVCYGWNSRLDNLQAAILNLKFKYLEKWIKKRREIAKTYNNGLSKIGELRLPPSPDSDPRLFDVFQNYILRAQRRDELFEFLKKKGIETLIKDPIPTHWQKNLSLSHFQLPYTEQLAKEVISLPIYPELDNKKVEYVISTVRKFYD